MWCIEIKENLPTLIKTSSARRQKSVSSRSTSHRGTDELSKGIRDLSVGMAKAAEGLGRELEKLQSRPRDSSAGRSKKPEEEKILSSGDEEEAATSTDRLREESGWKRLE